MSIPKDGTTTLGTGSLDATRHATFTTASLALGNHKLVALYAGDGNFNGSNSIVYGERITSMSTPAPAAGAERGATPLTAAGLLPTSRISNQLAVANASTIQPSHPNAGNVDAFFAKASKIDKRVRPFGVLHALARADDEL